MLRLVSDPWLPSAVLLLAGLFLRGSYLVIAMSNGKAKGPLGKVAMSPRQRVIINADEVVINRIPVNFVEYEEETQQVGKRTIVSRLTLQRTALINDYVPAELYDTFMAMYDDFLEIQAARKADSDVDEAAASSSEETEVALTTVEEGQALARQFKGEMLVKFQSLQYQLVLAVWRLTEPDMDEERLRQGIDEERLMGLFQHFFSRLSQQKKKSAQRAGNTSSAPEPGAGEA